MPRTVLVVDRVESLRETTRRMLGSKGYKTLDAGNAGEGLEAADTYKPDVVLIGFDMAPVDGYEFAEALLGKPYRHDMKVVLMSGDVGHVYEKHPDLRQSFDIYFDGFLEKPFGMKELTSAIHMALAMKKILVVDDYAALRSVLVRLLDSMGYEATDAPDVSSAMIYLAGTRLELF